jgi:hypothetical protein
MRDHLGDHLGSEEGNFAVDRGPNFFLHGDDSLYGYSLGIYWVGPHQ